MVFYRVNEALKKKKQHEGWKVERIDQRSIQFLFDTVTFTCTLMTNPKGNAHYPLDEWMASKNMSADPHWWMSRSRNWPVASKRGYRTAADILAGWTDVKISHGAVRNIVNKVGMAQALEDEAMVKELGESAEFPPGKKVDYLFAQADGVYLHGTKRKKGMEVRYAVMYEGLGENGNRVALKEQKVIMTIRWKRPRWSPIAMAARGIPRKSSRKPFPNLKNP